MAEQRGQRQASPGGIRGPDFGLTWKVSPDLLAIIDRDGRFERTNLAWAATLGWTEDDLRSRPFLEFVHADDVEPTEAAFARLLQGTPVLRFENRYRRAGGGHRWISWVSVPEGDKFHCSARDVTEEKKRAEELERRTAERDEIWRVSQDMLLVIDAEGVIRAVNDAWTRTLGFARSELVGSHFDSFVDPADVAPSYEALARASSAALPRFENRYRHKDGSWRSLSWTAAPGREFIHCVARDVTEDKARERELALVQERLRQSQKMEAVGQLTGGIAHDFNNLLGGIVGSLEILERRVAQGKTDGLDRYIGMARSGAKRAAALTQRLLAFARRQTLDPKPVDLNRLVSGMEELIRRTVGPDVELEVVAAVGLWTTKIDAPQLESALLNLCINGRDAMAPAGGKLTVETGNKWLDERVAKERDLAPGQYVSLCVSDTGVGMDASAQTRAFDPFFTTKPMGEGTGLGLSMVHGFVMQSGGQARIYSEVGQGTTLCLYFPRHAGRAADVDDPFSDGAAEADGDGEVVMVVEDEPTIRELVVEELAEAGYRTLDAGDGASALRVLQSSVRIDLLVTDVGLPGGMNGRQVADAARVARPGLKVLFITGYADNAAVGNGRLDQGMEVMTKPFDMSAFAAKVRGVLDRP